jgi:periplasmic protein TonB
LRVNNFAADELHQSSCNCSPGTTGPSASRFVPLIASAYRAIIGVTKVTQMHWINPATDTPGSHAGLGKQNIRLLVALSVLLLLLCAVLVKDRDFWFGSDQAMEAEAAQPVTQPVSASRSTIQKTLATPVAHPPAKNRVVLKGSSKPEAPVADADATAEAPAVTATRVALPPLDVEVVAGDNHRRVHPGSTITKVEIPSSSPAFASDQPVAAAERERILPAASPEIRQTIQTVYPTLGNNSRVQGSVVLQALIDADGNVENLRVLSGPAILAGAAQQAVREWHFKPVLQNGQPVETKARITVNFTIRVSDNPASAS